jgi:hypothetical protein
MKRLNIIMSVVLFTCTTVLLTMLPIVVDLDLGQWLVLGCLAVMGYPGAYLYFDNYVDLVIREQRQDIAKSWKEGHHHGYNMGHYAGYREGYENANKEASIPSMNALVDQDLIDLGNF